MSWHYTVYGLRVQSNGPLRGLRPASAEQPPDVLVTLGELPAFAEAEPRESPWFVSSRRTADGQPWLQVWRPNNGAAYHLRYLDGAQFVLDRLGSRIWATWPPALTFEGACVYLLGPVLAFLLRLRAVLSLHASAVTVDGHVLALLGPHQAGKSTTAMRLAQQGHALLSEDVVALSETPDGFFVQPGYNHVRLWPQSVAALFGSSEELPRLAPPWDKRFCNLADRGYGIQTQPLRLDAIYVLAERTTAEDAPSIQPLTAREAMMALVTNTSMNLLLDQSQRAQEFVMLSRLVASVAIRRVAPHAELARLDRLCELLLKDFRQQLRTEPATFPR